MTTTPQVPATPEPERHYLLLLSPNQSAALVSAGLPMLASKPLSTPEGAALANRLYGGADDTLQHTSNGTELHVVDWLVQLQEVVRPEGEVATIARLTLLLADGKALTTGSPHALRTFALALLVHPTWPAAGLRFRVKHTPTEKGHMTTLHLITDQVQPKKK